MFLERFSFFWNWLASKLGGNKSSCVKKALIAYAFKRPYNMIKHYDGSDYMSRWWIMPKFLLERDENGDFYPKKWVPLIVRLHHIHTEDYDRNYHDHPADARTIIIDGTYIEEDIYGNLNVCGSGSTRFMRAERFHRITEVSNGGVWTVFIMLTKRNEWGFIVDNKKVPWRKFTADMYRH